MNEDDNEITGASFYVVVFPKKMLQPTEQDEQAEKSTKDDSKRGDVKVERFPSLADSDDSGTSNQKIGIRDRPNIKSAKVVPT